MKKFWVALLTAGLMLTAVSCGQEKTEEPIVEIETVEEEPTEAEPVEEESVEEKSSDVDLDLTTLTSTMVYSEVFNMMMEPETYVGKTVRISGLCNIYRDSNTSNVYYSCIVKDATQCCAQGLEFVLDPDKYVDTDYPAMEDEITVTGTFATYEEGDRQYLTILDSVLE
jgi:hypothetical protein